MLPRAPALPLAQQVTVFGAAGFIGRFVVEELVRQGWRVRAAVRTLDSNPFLARPNIEVVAADVRDPVAVRAALEGSIAAVNLAGRKSDEPDSEAVNVGGAEHLISAAKAQGSIRLIHFSTQAVKLRRPGLYARTKLAADERFKAAGLPVTILRPSVVYGPGRSGVFSTMQRYIERLPVVPVLGDGTWVSAPLHVDDAARAVAVCLATPATIGRCYDLAGPDAVTLDELLDRIAAQCGRPCRKVHLPFGVALFVARMATRLLPRSPISVSNVLGSNQFIPIDLVPAKRDFDFTPMSLDDGLRSMPGNVGASLDDARLPTAHTPSAMEEKPSLLASDARLFARYLMHIELEPEICDRYVTAVRSLFAEEIDGDLAFVRRHPWALPFVDAIAGIVRPRSQIRQCVLLMTALLETSPAHADFFLAPPPRRVPLVLGLCASGLSGAAKLLGGALLLPFIPHHVARR